MKGLRSRIARQGVGFWKFLVGPNASYKLVGGGRGHEFPVSVPG
jgi:hypothetical protein